MAMKSTNSKGRKIQHTLILFGLTQFFLFLKLRKLSKNVGLMNLVIFLLLKIVVKNGNGHIWLITQGEDKPQITEITDHEKINRMIMIYWD